MTTFDLNSLNPEEVHTFIVMGRRAGKTAHAEAIKAKLAINAEQKRNMETIFDNVFSQIVGVERTPKLTPEYDSVAVCGESSLSDVQHVQLAVILDKLEAEVMEREGRYIKPMSTEQSHKPGKKMGVWVDGVLKLQTRDRDAIDDYAAKMVRPRTVVKDGKAYVTTHDIWVAPIGSFIPPQKFEGE